MNRICTGLILVVLLPVVVGAEGQDPGNETSPSGSPCSWSEASQFDFWVGEWDVLAQRKVVGRKVISRIHGGCTIFEEYGATGSPLEGKSFNYFDPADGHWHQVWIDNSGSRLHLTGGLEGRYRPAAAGLKGEGE